jgi:hypothetical protein
MIKEANESVSCVDSTMSPNDIAATREMKNWSTGTDQGLAGFTSPNTIDANKFGIEVVKCGEEPGSTGGCGRLLKDHGTFFDYSITIEGEKYRAYVCHICKHSLKPFSINYSKHPERYKKPRKKKRVKRLSTRLTGIIVEAATPSSVFSGGYNNPANTPCGRLDLTEDQRVIPWNKVEENYDPEYDKTEQGNNNKFKVVKIKGKNGKNKFVKIVDFTTEGDGVSPANSQKIKGRIKKQPRYNPADGKDKNDGFGAWPHNRDGNKGWYQSPQSNNLDTDLRSRVIPWGEYIRDRGVNMLTLTKPL